VAGVVRACRMCGSQDLAEFLDLGHQPPADAFLTAEQLKEPEVRYPLTALMCVRCGLAQLGYIVPKEILYGEAYPYESSTTLAGRTHFTGLARTIAERFNLGSRDLAVDIGSNVGVLLAGFQAVGTRVVGIEPVPKLAAQARTNGIDTVTAFFSAESVESVVQRHGRATAVTATNVFGHLDDLSTFVECLAKLLRQDGVLVVEVPYLVDLLERLEYDTVYHEHLSYIAVTPVARFFERHGFQVFDVERIPIHGGSIRIYVGYHGRRPRDARVDELTRLEGQRDIFNLATLRGFAGRVRENRLNLTKALIDLKAAGKRVVAVSAPAKGNTLLNYCNLHTGILDYATEKARLKIGLFTPGTHLPVVDDARLVADRPDYGLLLAWNFKDEIAGNLADFHRAGGKFITAIPAIQIT
jgi:SAM-dependent methyltransferase